ncbi:hypothetical protein HNR05_001406 [Leifsonia psychrotolerans]|uniref:Uncharacterized protein n=1 Tax=Glaciibacter psychrotolerans TaxID=670054 RepID=A0A7Z0EEA6_9MICO|nr:hypothetical protein [Leifsonia psychrotolerans]
MELHETLEGGIEISVGDNHVLITGPLPPGFREALVARIAESTSDE